MHRQGYNLQRTQYDERGWRATFYTTGIEHSPHERDGECAGTLAGDAAGGTSGAQKRGRGTVIG